MSNNVYPSLLKGLTWTVTKTPKFNSLVSRSAGGSEVRIAQQQNPLWTWQLIYEWLYDDFKSPANSRAYGYTDLQALMGFFLGRQGQFDDFLFDDPSDDMVTDEPQQIIGDGNGNWYTPLQRNLGGQFQEDITDLNTATALTVVANTLTVDDFVVVGPGLSVPGASFGGLYLQWNIWVTGTAFGLGDIIIDPAGHVQLVTTAGTTGATIPTFNDSGGTTSEASSTIVWTDQGLALISATFQFYFRVRFASDDQDFEQFMQELWTIGGGSGKNGKGTLELTTSRVPLGTINTGVSIPGVALAPPTGQRVVILWPWQPNPPVSGQYFGSLAVTGSDGSLTGEFNAFANGSDGGISLYKGSITRSVDPSPSAAVFQFRLPPFVLQANVTRVYGLFSASKFDNPITAAAPITHVITSYDEHALILMGVLGAVGGTAPVGGPISNTFDSYSGRSQYIQLAPSANPDYWSDPTMVPFEDLGLEATLGITVYGRSDCGWSGGMALAVWYTPI